MSEHTSASPPASGATPDRASDLLGRPSSGSHHSGTASSIAAISDKSNTPDLDEDDDNDDLSSLDTISDVDDDDEGEKKAIPQPSSFYPNEHAMNSIRREELDRHAAHGATTILRPEDDPFCSRGIPIFSPSMEEFKDFEGYMEAILPWGQRSGIVKVIPPAEWTGGLPAIPKRTISDLKIKNPIQQNMQGISGLYRQNTIEKKRTLSVKDWFEKCTTPPFRGPGPKDSRRAGADERAAAPNTSVSAGSGGGALRNRRSARKPVKIETGIDREGETESKSLVSNSAPGSAGIEATTLETQASVAASIESDAGMAESTAESVPPECSPTRESESDRYLAVPKDMLDPIQSDGLSPALLSTHDKAGTGLDTLDPFYDNLDVRTSWLPEETKEEDYSVDACRELERRFWRALSLGEPSWYGADLKGSLFTDETQAWNVAKLPNLLNRLKLKTKLPGVNTTYLYFGMWAAAFAWHVEDCDLWSINYIHFGAPKQWYSIPPAQSESFERKMAGYFPQDSRQCKQFLRHKSFTVSPAVLARDGCRPNVLVQKQGEFVITYPRGYHSGYNLGFNCAESINFALESWIELGRRAQHCTCVEDSVRIDVDAVLAESALLEAIEKDREERRRQAETRRLEHTTRPQKRVRVDSQQGSTEPRKRKKADGRPGSTIDIASQERAKRARELACRRSCIFCPDTSNFPTLPIHDPPPKYSRSDGVRGHIACARSIPELWVEEVDEIGMVKREMIMGTSSVARERWLLKCTACADKKNREMGAKIQCTKGKCTRAFHVICAMQQPLLRFAEVETEEWVAIVQNSGAPTYELVRQIKAELLCSQHNPASHHLRRKQADLSHKDRISGLNTGSPVELRWSGGYKLETLFLGPIEGVEDIVQVLSEDGLPLDVPIHRVFPIPQASEDVIAAEAPARHALVPPREELFRMNPVDLDKVALTPKLCSILSENPMLRALLEQVNDVS